MDGRDPEGGCRTDVCRPVYPAQVDEQLVRIERRARPSPDRDPKDGRARACHPARRGQEENKSLMGLHVIDHPLVAHYLTRLRDRDTAPDEFREASDKIITLLLYEATRDLRTRAFRVNTPLEETERRAVTDSVGAVHILRAGLGHR